MDAPGRSEVDQAADQLFDALLLDALLGVVLEVRRQRLVPSGADEEAFSADAYAAAAAAGNTGGGARPAADAFGCAPPALPTEELRCPHCTRAVGAARFAPHLQNCLGKGRNAQRAATKRGAPPTELYVPSWSPKARPKKAKPAAAKVQHWDDAFLPPGFHTHVHPRDAADAPALRTVDVMTWAPKNAAGIYKAAPAPVQGAGQHTAPAQRSMAQPALPPAGGAAPPPAPAPPPKSAKAPSDGARRRELRAFLTNNVALPDLQSFVAHPPPAGLRDEQLPRPHAVIRAVATGMRDLEPQGAPGASDVALLLANTCLVVSQRSGTIGRLCSNGLNCSNHGDEQRHVTRAAVFGRGAEQSRAAAPPVALPPVALHMTHPSASAWMPHNALLMPPVLYHDTPVTQR